jgi:hypothetical protein
VSDPVLIRKYPVHSKLGRHQRLDPRSLNFVETGAGVHLGTVDHEPPCPVLDQEDLHAQGISVRTVFPDARGLDDADALGSCVGNATVAHASQMVGMAALDLPVGDAVAAEVLAIRRYHRATQLDEDLADQYPSVDCGSSGLGSAKACKADRLISGYRHATTARGVVALLQTNTAVIGMPWFNQMFSPDRDGFIDSGQWQRSGIAGGHELCLTAVEALVLHDDGSIDLARTVLRVRNSWGRSWGDHGSGRMRLSTYQALRRQIDVVQFVA